MRIKKREAGVVLSEDNTVLAQALGVPNQDHDRQKGATPPMTLAQSGRRNVLNNMKVGSGNRKQAILGDERGPGTVQVP